MVRGPLTVLHEYAVELHRDQYTELYVIASNEQEAEDKALEMARELTDADYEDGDVEVINISLEA